MFNVRFFLSETDSTMNFAFRIVEFISPPFIVVSEVQSGGYGQYGRKWVSPARGLWFTEVLNIERKEALSLFLSLPIIRVLNSLGLKNIFVKWPNDVYLNNKKIAGILVKVKGKTVVAGIGLNVRNEIPTNLRETADSLKGKINVGKMEMLDLIIDMQNMMMKKYKKFGFKPFVREYEEHLIFLKKPIKVKTNFVISGIAKGVNESGNLILDTNSGETSIVSGTVVKF